MMLNVVNTTMTLKGMGDKPLQADGVFDATNPYTTRSGYGTYTIGQAHENFYGVDMNVGTYANIMTGGYATYGAMCPLAPRLLPSTPIPSASWCIRTPACPPMS